MTRTPGANKAYLTVINTGNQSYGSSALVHSAAQPYAVVEFDPRSTLVNRVFSRHESYKGACISCGKRVKRLAKESA